MTRDDLEQALDALGDGPSAERVARQRVRLAEWERRRQARPAWLTGGMLGAAVALASVCVVLFAWRGFKANLTPGVSALAADKAYLNVPHAGPSARGNEPAAVANSEVHAALRGSITGQTLDAQLPSVQVQQPSQLEPLQWLDAARGPIALSFAEGSQIDLAKGSRGRISELGTSGLSLSLEAGRVDARITPGQGYRWVVHAGPYQVVVVGTVFSVDWQPNTESLAVSVTRGKVQVRGGDAADAPKELVAGETLRVSAREKVPPARTSNARERVVTESEARVQTDSPEGGASAEGALAVSARTLAPQAPSAELAAAWKAHAERGEYQAAFEAAQAGGFDRLTRTSSASDLLLLADSARLSGASQPARTALLALRDRFPQHPNATVAAFVLGRLAFEQGDDAESVRWLRAYLEQGATGPLAEGARWRLFSALARSGETAEARRVATDYLKRHPDGRHADEARRLLPE